MDAEKIARAQEFSPAVVREWITTFDALVKVERDVHVATSTPGLSPLEVVKAAVRVRRSHASLCSFEDYDELWNVFPPRVLQMLSEMVKGSVNFDTYDDILVREDPATAKTPHLAKYYLRLATLPNPIQSNRLFLDQYPAEAPATILRLICLQDNLSDLKGFFINSMSEFYHDETAANFLDHVEARYDAVELRTFIPRVVTAYAGIAIVSTTGNQCGY
jgi:hypothetical protein